jgi:flagellar assembly protein FliH
VCLNNPAKVEVFVPDIENDYDDCNITEEDIQDITVDDIPENIRNKAQRILERSKDEAKEIIDKAMIKIEEERDIILEQAKKNGYEDGYNQAINDCEDIIQEASMIKERALRDAEAFLSNIEDETVSVIMDIARKVVGFEISFNREDILYIAKEALENCTHKEHVMLKVSETDYETVIESKNKLIAMVQGVGDIEIKIDYSLEPGGCLLETPFGAVDGSASTRLNEIEKVFRGLVGRE